MVLYSIRYNKTYIVFILSFNCFLTRTFLWLYFLSKMSSSWPLLYPAGGPDVRGLQDSLRSRAAQPHVVGATLSWTQLLSTCKIFMSTCLVLFFWHCTCGFFLGYFRVFSDFQRRLNTCTPCTVLKIFSPNLQKCYFCEGSNIFSHFDFYNMFWTVFPLFYLNNFIDLVCGYTWKKIWWKSWV